ncbi:MBOAT family protein [bacterium]|nr:MAG: MBOAT family protein [bacterium]
MQFNSLVFIVFAAAFFAMWPAVRTRRNSRWIAMVIASFVFYGWWDWRFLFLITASGLIDFFASLGIERFPRHKRLILVVSMLGNVGSLAVFKYLDFAIGTLNGSMRLLGADMQLPMAHLILPVGISFYTFQSMSYTIDVYRGELRATRNVFHFFAYLSLFPQLVAGPIIRARDLLPQLESAGPVTEHQRWEGLKLIVFGYFKKVVIADTLATAVNAAFAAPSPADSACYWWIIMVMFAFQIFCDFSGYSDIARGLAKWMGYEFPVNFDNPYTASSFREFWQRWNISLSTWFRDYVYIPLGGSRCGKRRAVVALWLTMLISGLWHGAAWTFVLWGALHAFYLSLERLTDWPRKLARLPAGRHLAPLAVFALTVVAWVLFRARTFDQAIAVFARMFNPAGVDYALAHKLIDNNAINVLLIIIGHQVAVHLGRTTELRWPERSRAGALFEPVAIAVVIVICVFMRAPSNTFIYFQF